MVDAPPHWRDAATADNSPGSRFSGRTLLTVLAGATVAAALVMAFSGGPQAARASDLRSAATADVHAIQPRLGIPVADAELLAPTSSATTPASQTLVSALVEEVEAFGIQPGSNWTWSMGDTATHCFAIAGAGTGCTYGTSGKEYSVFSGSPNLPLVAHELANAETQNDAVPSLLRQVAAAEGGTSWSPTDAVASCLVTHFMGFQDNAAGDWHCPPALATLVAENIHDTA
jgi:hypothetical protein